MEYTRELVYKKVSQLFPEQDRERIMDILNWYGHGACQPAKESVQLAVLKLAQNNEEKIRKLIDLALVDRPEDVLWPAEEPNFSAVKDVASLAEEEIKRIQEKDRKQYLDWLNG